MYSDQKINQRQSVKKLSNGSRYTLQKWKFWVLSHHPIFRQSNTILIAHCTKSIAIVMFFLPEKILVCWESVNWNTQVRGSSLLYNILALRSTKGGKTSLVSARNWKFAQKTQKQQVPHNCKLIYWSPVTNIMGMLSPTSLMWRLFLSLMLMMKLTMLLMTMLLVTMLLMTMLLMMLPPTLQM